MKETYKNLVVVLGHTAGGKTTFAAHLGKSINGEIISADSRQVYRGMDIGTGKDLEDYYIDEEKIPFHLIDIRDAGEKYNVYEFQKDFLKAFADIHQQNKMPILCGGTGMYLQAALEGYQLIHVPVDEQFRNQLQRKTNEELAELLQTKRTLHNVSDTKHRKRLIRAIEIASYYEKHPEIDHFYPDIKACLIGIKFDRNSRRKRITQRLKQRLNDGMIDEVKHLLEKIPADTLIYYGLEYKFITQFLLGELNYNEMVEKLNTAIHQFAKRQMTWFRKMEREGYQIHWLDGYLPLEKKITQAREWIFSNK